MREYSGRQEFEGNAVQVPASEGLVDDRVVLSDRRRSSFWIRICDTSSEGVIMSLTSQLVQILTGMTGFRGLHAQTVSVTEPADVHLELDVTSVDSLSCAFRELRLTVPAFQKSGVDQLKLWADDLCRRVTYLLEQLGALEIDPVSGQAQIRSTRPDRQDDQTRYYEIVLQNPGLLILRRYQIVPGSNRDQIDLQTTLEVLQKLVPDLVQSALTGN